ncbi:MAG: CO dehydrogenase/acetyl-CoA synthase complex subunit epsilon [Candidatus Hodarchaeota archaeon]
MPHAKPWQKAATNPEMGVAVYDPNVVANIIKDAKKPYLVVGAMSLKWKVGDELYIDVLLRLAKAANLPVIATAHSNKHVIDSPLASDLKVIVTPLVNLTNRLEDGSGWNGFEGDGKPDLVIYAGITTYYISQMLATMKNFTEQLKTLTIDREYQGNARFSLGNINKEEWAKFFEVLISKFA